LVTQRKWKFGYTVITIKNIENKKLNRVDEIKKSKWKKIDWQCILKFQIYKFKYFVLLI